MTKIIYTFALLFYVNNVLAQTALVPSGSIWKYLDNGSNQGTAWRTTSFNDGSWKSGPALLGYGHGDEATVVNGGPSGNRYTTTYFRKTISNASNLSNYTLRVRRDDGIVVYINGEEEYRNNMPSGTIAYNTWASTTASDDGYTWFSTTLATGSLVTGTNVIAVEIHQRKPTSNDITFDLELTGNDSGTGGPDVTPPIISTYSPEDNATDISRTANLVLTFSENIQKGSGNILVKEGGVLRQTIGVTNSNVTVSGNSATINPADFASGAGVNIEIAAGAFKDHANNNYAGISNATTWNFTVQSSGGTSALLTRGPYLQMGNQNAATLRWRTNVATDSKIEVGTTYGTYTLSATNATVTTEHEVRITGLAADTKYYYRFGSSSQKLQSANDNYFTTVPPPTTARKIRIAAFGDCGRNSLGHQSNTLTAYRNYLANNGLDAADAWLLLGDNAYNDGTDAEYTSNFFNAYGNTILKNHKLYPVLGNHDYANSSSNQASHNVPYFNIFSLPANAECGGVPSGNERYYSYDIGNVHFLALDSYGKENGGTTRLFDTSGAQVTWIKKDLAANTKKWTIAYWHHPPYTMGSHNSDNSSELVNIRQRFIRILERLGVDVILCGHSHDYERSYFLNGYYSNESSFSVSAHTKSSSSGKYDGSSNSCPYFPAAGANHGTVYVVSGSAGASGGTQSGYPHNAMPWSVNDGGMTYIEVQENRLDHKFIRMNGTVWDRFTIMKDVKKTTNLSIASGRPTTLTASWPSGTYRWSNGSTTRSITVSPTSNTRYTVSDNTSGTCVTDVFNITITSGARVESEVADVAVYTLKIQPTLVKKGQSIRLQTNSGETTDITLVDISGKIIRILRFAGTGYIDTQTLQAGTYFIKVKDNKTAITQKIVVTE
ncbi:T9SS type A sorting domain-containing protein [Niastella caeni]|uniref:T9SS type A sorting domain-containing protein n=1 Tax=Niastella caeni TaxID=2569763 RepID=A0A4S8HI49_9BACT|nr:metallophosphoesterase [Niastella caeni]THU34201.1 T9SS type A sorting domain-containing protein [Niastella caeni]